MRPEVIVFDLYGTLLRIDALRARVAAAHIPRPDAFMDLWRAKQIEYAWCSSIMDEYRDFDSLTLKALTYALDAHEAPLEAAARTELAAGWLSLDPYPDVASTLATLRKRDVPLAVLTNGVKASAERALRDSGIRDALDDVLSVESVRVYKPDPRVYKLVTARFACEPERVLFVSSNGWDASGAAAFGFRVAWCNRAGKPAESLGFAPATTLASLADVVGFLAG